MATTDFLTSSIPTTTAANAFSKSRTQGVRLCVKVGTCNLNQWAMDFDGNLERIKESIQRCKDAGCVLRIGPELEITGYGCEDHFYEQDTFMHSWQSMANIIESKITNNILCCIGMPIFHKSAAYNCNVWILNSKIILIRPKMFLANDGNYREMRYFVGWHNICKMDMFVLPPMIQKLTDQYSVPIGCAIIETQDTSLANETCEELFTPNSPHIQYALNGVEFICNSSGSHHNLRKLNLRVQLMRNASARCGGVYIYSNQQGCDGSRLYFDGSSMIFCNGNVLAQGTQFSVSDDELVTAVIDLSMIRSKRHVPSFGAQADLALETSKRIPRVSIYNDYNIKFNMSDLSRQLNEYKCVVSSSSSSMSSLSHNKVICTLRPTMPQILRFHTPEEEIAFGPSCWLWDYLKRSNASGFFLPLSGGADSSSTAALVGIMCQLIVKAIENGDKTVLNDVRRVVGLKYNISNNNKSITSNENDKDMANENKQNQNDNNSKNVNIEDDGGYVPKDARELCHRIFHTCYMGTKNSSKETRERSKELANEIGSYHIDCNIDVIVNAMIKLFEMITGKIPKYKVYGGCYQENIALQNIQARLRMVLSYMLAQLLPWVRRTSDKERMGWLLVLGSANVDEALRGYFTKYDCSSADINPIGGICKNDLKRFLLFAANKERSGIGYKSLYGIVSAKPTAELEPITDVYQQTDEIDMGMTYSELGVFGKLRNLSKCGPVSMYQKLEQLWGQPPDEPTNIQLQMKEMQQTIDKKNDSNEITTAATTTTTTTTMTNKNNNNAAHGKRESIDATIDEAILSQTVDKAEDSFEILKPSIIAEKVKKFFKYYSINRHKLTILTPSYHAENYSPDDNRFDHRQFLYPNWQRQFDTIDKLVENDEKIFEKEREMNQLPKPSDKVD